MQMWVQSLGQEHPLEDEMATHSSILALGNPMDRRAWRATAHGVAKSLTRLSLHMPLAPSPRMNPACHIRWKHFFVLYYRE